MKPIRQGKASGIPSTFYRVSIKGLILDEVHKKFAVILEDNGWWELPGGGLEWGEPPKDCLKRELQEEMGLTVTKVAEFPSYLLFGKNMRGNWTLNLVFEIKVKDLNFKLSNECQDLKFVSPIEIQSMQAFRTVKELGKQFNSRKYTLR
jgi:ADP-ribose pyrophosphatase YjhB (NUDIX family)